MTASYRLPTILRRRPGAVQQEWIMALALSLMAALVRAPYLALIPVFEDEALQTVYALSIEPGRFLPLVGNDPYAGALFSYIIAASLRVFGATPAAPRIVVMAMGALTVGMTYLLARALGLGRAWAALVGLLMLANPYHILIASHYAGATYSLPFFSTAFFLALALSVKRESGLGLVAAGALLGLAMQTNPVLALILPGVGIWFLIQRKASLGLRTRWPYLAAVAFLLAYAPVIVHNLQTGLTGFQQAGSDRICGSRIPLCQPTCRIYGVWRSSLAARWAACWRAKKTCRPCWACRSSIVYGPSPGSSTLRGAA